MHEREKRPKSDFQVLSGSEKGRWESRQPPGSHTRESTARRKQLGGDDKEHLTPEKRAIGFCAFFLNDGELNFLAVVFPTWR